MTISTTQSRVSYNGNGVTTDFAFPILFFKNSDLQVRKVSSAGVTTTLILTTDYTVTGAGVDGGGTVSLFVAPAAGETLVINRVVDLVQETDYISGDPFPAETHERALDLLTMQTQQLQESVGRAVRIPETDPATLDMTLAPAQTRANTFMFFDATGKPGYAPVGSPNAPSVITRQRFSGDGVTTVFTLARDPGAAGASVVIYIGGLYQNINTYGIVGTTLTFTEAPPEGTENIEVVQYAVTNIGETDAGQVTYTPSGTGAVATNVQDRLRNIDLRFPTVKTLNVLDLGLIGDGVTDDQPALAAAILAHPRATFFFPPNKTYCFKAPVIPGNGQTFYGEDRETTVLLWDNLTPGISDNPSSAIDDVTFTGLMFTNNFDITQHIAGQDASVTGQHPLFNVVGLSGSRWRIFNCKFTQTYRQAIRTQGPTIEWLIRDNRFINVAREALFSSSNSNGAPTGILFTHNTIQNCGDDALNFRNGFSNLCAFNYIKQSGRDDDGNPINAIDGFGTVRPAALKVHGDHNIFMGNVIECAGNRVFEARSSNSALPILGAANGNYFIGNVVRRTDTARGSLTSALAFALTDSGKNYVIDNHIEWIDDAPAIKLTGPADNYPSTTPAVGSSVFIHGNTFVKMSNVIVVEASAKHNIVEIKDNLFDQVYSADIVSADAILTYCERFIFEDNRMVFAGANPNNGFFFNFGTTTTSPDWRRLEIRRNRINNGQLASFIQATNSVYNRCVSLEFEDNSWVFEAPDAFIQRVGDLIVRGRRRSVREHVIFLQDDTVKEIITPFQNGFVFLTGTFSSQKAFFWARPVSAGGGLGSDVVNAGANVTILSNGTDLTGTTGIDGNVTVSVRDGFIQVENRTGSARQFRIAYQ